MAFVGSKKRKGTKAVMSGECSVPDCRENEKTSFMAATNNLRYCEFHNELATEAYKKYKDLNSLQSGSKEKIREEIKLRTEFGQKYTKGLDPTHKYYIELLRKQLL